MLADITIYLGVMLAGLLSFLSPCVLPLVPPYLGYLGGTTIDQLSQEGADEAAVSRRVLIGAVCFVAGFTCVFVGLGAGASAIGQQIVAYKQQLAAFAGLVIFIFGLHFLGVLRVTGLYSDTRFHTSVNSGHPLGAFVMGLAFAFGWTPCIGPILSTVLTVAANEGTLGAGVKLLLAYSLGLGIPFILAALAIRQFMGFFRRFRPYLARMEVVMGMLLVITGLLFMTGSIGWIGQWLVENVPFLSTVEDWISPKSLQGEILRRNPQ